MSVRNIVDMIMNVSGILGQLRDAGMRVEIGDDFAQYRNYRLAQTDRKHIYPMFDVTNSYIDRSNGFWICGFNDGDELIHTQAVRTLDLSGANLGEHLDMHRHKYITPGTTPDPDQTFYRGPEGLKAISGRVCYHGEFWLAARGLGGPRSQGVTPLLSRILFELVSKRWAPDYTVAFVPKQLAAKGAHLRYGYSHCEPGKWLGPDQQVTEEDYLIWMNAGDLSNLLAREPLSLERGTQISPIRTSLAAIDTKG